MGDRVLRPRPKPLSYMVDSDQEASGPSEVHKAVNKPQKPTIRSITKYHSASRLEENPSPLQDRLPDVPEFTPMKEYYPVHAAYNQLPPALNGLAATPILIFKLFFPDALFDTLATNTNSYARSKREDPLATGRSWVDISVKELRVWIGICIYMGIFKSPALEDYWKHDGLHPLHPITKYMSLTRFEQVKRYLHVSPVNIPTHTTDGCRLWHGKIDILLDQLCKSSQAYRVPSTNISIDEAIIRCTGRSLDTYKMPSKPIEHGFKFHCLADHGYIWDFHRTSNQVGPDPVPTIEGLTPTGEVVYFLASKLPKRKTWHIYFDNYYTSLPLLEILRGRLDVGACGTARPSSKDFPQILAIPKKDVGKVPYHFRAGMVIRGVGVLLWFDNAPVTMMTTIHHLKGEQAAVMKMRKRPGRKSTNNKQALAEFGDNQEKELEIPASFNDYNHHMGGVDIADQYRTYYDTQLTTFRTWFPIFFWILDTMLINGFHILSTIVPIEHKQFRLQVAWDLILEGSRVGEVEGGSIGKCKSTTTTLAETSSKKHKYVTNLTMLPPSRGDGEHLPEPFQGRDECWLCRYKLKEAAKTGTSPGGRGHKTQWHCPTCEVPLCMVASRNCFTEFHKM